MRNRERSLGAPAAADFVTPWGRGVVLACSGMPVEIRLPSEDPDRGPCVREITGVNDAPVVGGEGVSPVSRAPVSHAYSADDARVAQAWAEQIEAYVRGERSGWTREEVPVAAWLGGPAGSFAAAVYEALLDVPAGETVTYGQLAARAGYPGAARAVGSAMARNPFPVVVPCHRVIRSDGRLGNYGTRPELKKELLRLEGAL